MAEVVRTLRKQGAKNREINESMKEAMKLILEKRQQKADQVTAELKARQKAKYIVNTGIFKDHVFNGHPIVISGEDRIWDDDSVGNSYPATNCSVLEVEDTSTNSRTEDERELNEPKEI